MPNNISEIAQYVTIQQHEKDAATLEERRISGERRLERRVGLLELADSRMRETVIGKNGDNGLASRVKVLDHVVARNWTIFVAVTSSVGGVVLTIATAMVIKYLI